MWTGDQKGNRAIIGGFSPGVRVLSPDLLNTGFIIGINKWAAEFPCDYWIGLDTGVNWRKYYLDDPKYPDEPKFLKTLACPRFMRQPNKDTEAFVPADAGVFFTTAQHGEIPTAWDGRLRWESSTALAAINLAIILGASEVVLYGVDFTDGGRADGSQYHRPDFWQKHREPINRLLKQYQDYLPIYKTNPASWLDCPLLEGL